MLGWRGSAYVPIWAGKLLRRHYRAVGCGTRPIAKTMTNRIADHWSVAWRLIERERSAMSVSARRRVSAMSVSVRRSVSRLTGSVRRSGSRPTARAGRIENGPSESDETGSTRGGEGLFPYECKPTRLLGTHMCRYGRHADS